MDIVDLRVYRLKWIDINDCKSLAMDYKDLAKQLNKMMHTWKKPGTF